ncbi:S-adenosyl-L-methionine-dependent methyltransferase [Apiospora phragmitis]|uniref:S-adenosyl-L-methionine-dependent methyltransferase n=1 Tax=Apiospora phragmitis TaxID=2905665 RepID=A0ABR1VQE5_9PEZI
MAKAIEIEEPVTVTVATATSPSNLAAVPQLIKELAEGVGCLESGCNEARQALVTQARSLVQALETPRETMIKHCWAQPAVFAAILCGNECGLWKLMAKNGDKPQKVKELACALGVDPVLLSAMGYLLEVGEDEYKPTSFSLSLSLPIMNGGYPALITMGGPSFINLHEYERSRNWKNPTDAKDSPLMHAHKTDLNYFDLAASRGYLEDFNNHMGGYRQGRLPWMAPEFVPVQEVLIKGADQSPDAVFMVDVGGCLGHDLLEFHRYHPTVPGKLIVQDLPQVVGSIIPSEENKALTPMAHNFFEEQPIKGARAYYLHSVLHDWPDDRAEVIVGRIKAAMRPGYSKLLINENVIPRTDAYWETSALDLVMLSQLSAQERTERDWRDLVEGRCGLAIVKIWSGGRGVESLIEYLFPIRANPVDYKLFQIAGYNQILLT